MVPRKLVEIAFQRLWLLLIPVVAVPALVFLLQDEPAEYRSSAVIWIGDAPGGAEPALGHYNAYLTPSQNQVNALNDLLATESFRDAVAKEAGLPVLPGADHPHVEHGTVWAYSTGVNLLVIAATGSTGEQARATVAAVISQFNSRAASQADREAGLSGEYYRQQLAVAEEELARRRKAVDDYLRAQPAAATPGSAASLSLDYQTLVGEAEDQLALVAQLRSRLQDVELKRVSAPQSQEAAFAVQDEPESPAAPVPLSATRRIGYPVAGLLLGAFLSIAYVYVVYRTDHTVLSSEDLDGLGLALLGRVPELHSRSRLLSTLTLARFSRRHRDFARHTASAISAEARHQA